MPVLAYLLINRVKSNVDEDGEPRNSFWIRTYVPAITFADLSTRGLLVGDSKSDLASSFSYLKSYLFAVASSVGCSYVERS